MGWGVLFIYTRSWRSLIVCRFSSLRLWTNMECAYCVAIMLICLNVFLIFVIGIVNVVSSFFIDGICVVPPKVLKLNTKAQREQMKEHNHKEHKPKNFLKHNAIATNNSHINWELKTHILQVETHNHQRLRATTTKSLKRIDKKRKVTVLQSPFMKSLVWMGGTKSAHNHTYLRLEAC